MCETGFVLVKDIDKVINMNKCTLCMCIYFEMLSSQWIHEDKMSPCTVSTTGDNLCKEG